MALTLLPSGCRVGLPAYLSGAIVPSRPRTLRTNRRRNDPASQAWRSVPLLWAIVLIGAALLVGLLLGRPVAAVTGAGEQRDPVAEMKAEEARRDSTQIESLTAQARRMRDGLLPILEGLATTMPVGSSSLGTVATREQVASWKTVTQGFVAEFAERPSAGTAVNIGRSALAASVRQLDLAVTTYAQALDAPDRDNRFTTAARQRDLGIVAWSVAATQLDVLNIDSGRGHVHIFLPAQPGQGALTSDGAPEGSK